MEDTRELRCRENLKRNLAYVMRVCNISTQKQMAVALGISEPNFSKIYKDGSIPTFFPFFDNLRKLGFSADEMLYCDMQEREQKEQKNHDVIPERFLTRYLGLFQIYHFQTDNKKGRFQHDHGSALRAGVAFVYRNPEKRDVHHALAVFDMKTEDAAGLYQTLEHIQKESGDLGVCDYLSGSTYHVYEGAVEFSLNQVYYTFKYETRDKAYLIFHVPDGTGDQYIGGLGCMLSTSKGREHKPCMQNVAFSKQPLMTAKEEIASYLLTHFPKITTLDYISDLETNILGLYHPAKNSQKKRLSEEERRMLLRFHLDMAVNETVEKNLQRMLYISTDDNSDWYDYLKAVMHGKYGEHTGERGKQG